MNWAASRERLGAELIGARDEVAAHWRATLREHDALPMSLDAVAAELVLQAGAALADEMPPETPWCRCGGLLRIDARGQGAGLAAELTLLWKAMATSLSGIAFGEDEERAARDQLGLQLEAALRGAAAEVRETLLEEPVEEPGLRFGGIKALVWDGAAEDASETRAA